MNILFNLLIKCPIIIILYFLTSPLLRAGQGRESPEKNRLAVIGVFNEITDDQWKDYRIGFGVSSLLSQVIYDTGEFTPLEEKQEIKEKIKEFSTGVWQASGAEGYNLTDSKNEAQLLGADYIAYGRIIYFGKPQSKFSIGPMHRNTQETIIKIEVTLINLNTNKKISAEGTGKSVFAANSILFQFRDDNSISFDQTNVGKATEKAIDEAVKKMMKDIQKIKTNN